MVAFGVEPPSSWSEFEEEEWGCGDEEEGCGDDGVLPGWGVVPCLWLVVVRRLICGHFGVPRVTTCRGVSVAETCCCAWF